MKRNSIGKSVAGAAEYRPVTLTFVIDAETGEEETSEAVARPVSPPPALVRLIKKFQEQLESEGAPELSDTEAVTFLEGLARILAASIKSWDVIEEDGTPIEPTFETFSNWFPEELLIFFGALQQALAAAPKGN